MKILVTGACGYKGSVLVPKLLAGGYKVVALDIMWFGNFLKPQPGLTIVRGDVRDTAAIDLSGVDAIIHLASVANDPCGDLDPKLTWEISALATMQLADKAVRQGVSRFIYASSGSVYGVKEEAQVTEDLELEPISEYNKTKMVAERVLLCYAGRPHRADRAPRDRLRLLSAHAPRRFGQYADHAGSHREQGSPCSAAARSVRTSISTTSPISISSCSITRSAAASTMRASRTSRSWTSPGR